MLCSRYPFSVREVNDQITTLPTDVQAEIEKRLPEKSKSIGVPIHDLRIIIAGMVGTVEEGDTENLTPEGEAEFLIHISLRVLQQFTGLDV